ncbi:MAG: PAS domain S-box protein, partial [Polyangiaceae bacterium]|nr:PAS domain S-box protein [Polyangiaceae bacterium]
AVVVEGHDVSAQREVERKLRESHFRWRTIADFTVDWEYWLHPGGHFLYSSPACQRISGYGAEEFTEGRITLPALACPEDRKRVLELLTQAFSGSTGHSHRWRLMRRDGHVRWVSMSWQPVEGDSGRFMGVRGSVRDVTETAEAEQAQKRTLEAYRTLARHFPRGMVALLDRQMRFVVVDGPALEYLQVNADRLLGKSLLDIIDKSILPAARAMCREALSGHEVSDNVQFGPSTWLVHFTPIPDAEGRITQIVASAVESPGGWPEDPTQPPVSPRRGP